MSDLDPKGIYRSRCVATQCSRLYVTFAPIAHCAACGMPVTQVEFRPEGTEGEDETILGLAEDVLAGFGSLLSSQ